MGKARMWLVAAVIIIGAMLLGSKWYVENTEINSRAYVALAETVKEFPLDKALKNSLIAAMEDGSITNKEHSSLVDLIIENHGSYKEAPASIELDKAKELLTETISN